MPYSQLLHIKIGEQVRYLHIHMRVYVAFSTIEYKHILYLRIKTVKRKKKTESEEKSKAYVENNLSYLLK